MGQEITHGVHGLGRVHHVQHKFINKIHANALGVERDNSMF